jgi:hypothetical protein
MRQFVVRITMENEAFCGGGARTEVSRTLREVAKRIEDGFPWGGSIMDINGNKVGEHRIALGPERR